MELLIFSQGIICSMFSFMFFIDLLQYGTTLRAIGTAAVLLGYVLETGLVWNAYKIYTTELFPTCIRSIALSTFSCTSLLGSMATPQLTYMSKTWHPAPYLGAAAFAGLSTLFSTILLPETRFMALPDNLKEATDRKILYTEESENTKSDTTL
uniref:Uncharacterized protein n=1 Tax=Ditylenchus dipsaci TaxID=166011 RepID=A0A915D7T0_9BILA